MRVGELLTDLLAGTVFEPEVLGLLALMHLQGSRAAARVGPDGALRTLEEQDRSLWDAAAIRTGLDTLARSRATSQTLGVVSGPYALQAAIAAAHAMAPTADATDHRAIADLYARLAGQQPTPVVALNRAVAEALAGDLDGALARIRALDADGALRDYHLLPAAEADLLRRAGRHAESIAPYERALALAPSDLERAYLSDRLQAARSHTTDQEEPDA